MNQHFFVETPFPHHFAVGSNHGTTAKTRAPPPKAIHWAVTYHQNGGELIIIFDQASGCTRCSFGPFFFWFHWHQISPRNIQQKLLPIYFWWDFNGWHFRTSSALAETGARAKPSKAPKGKESLGTQFCCRDFKKQVQRMKWSFYALNRWNMLKWLKHHQLQMIFFKRPANCRLLHRATLRKVRRATLAAKAASLRAVFMDSTAVNKL